MNHRPVFVFGLHRSGSTLVERILNCHPNLVIWGEHAGILNHLAAMDDAIRLHPDLNTPLADRGLERFLKNKTPRIFDPWRSTVSLDGARTMARGWMLETFALGLTAEQRWGFKEIRYGGEPITRFLMELFPEGQFLLVQRDLKPLCLSNILCEWSLQQLAMMGKFRQEDEAKQVVSDCAYAISAMHWRLEASRRIAGRSAMTVPFDDVSSRVEDIFAFLGLPMTERVRKDCRDVVGVRNGQTNRGLSLGLLNKAFIEKWADPFLMEAKLSLAAYGLDRARLTAQKGEGRYCFLVGDHATRGTGSSSMGWTL